MRIYNGSRTPGQAGPGVVAVRDDRYPTRTGVALNPRTDLRNHSPDGFQWGYGGSGPAQLALALCCDTCIAALPLNRTAEQQLHAQNRALAVYQQVKATLIAAIQTDVWRLDSHVVMGAILSAEAKRGR